MKPQSLRTCEFCKDQFAIPDAWVRKGGGRFCSMACKETARRAPSRIICEHGYVLVRCRGHHLADQNGYVYEHRLIAEQSLGRRLAPGEEVHHKNQIRHDNRVENLEVLPSAAAHRREHASMRIRERGGDPAADRICSTCDEVKPQSEFSMSSKRGKPELSSRCKSCMARRAREIRQSKKELACQPN